MSINNKITELETKNLVIGAVPDIQYESFQIKINPKSKLYIYSDGAYEIKQKNGEMWTTKEMMEFLSENATKDSGEVEALYQYINKLRDDEILADDYSFLAVTFL